MGHIKASLGWQTKESGKPKKNNKTKRVNGERKGAKKKRRRKKNSGTQTWTGRQTLSAFLLSNAVKRLQSCKGSLSAPENVLPGSQAARQPGWEAASQPYQEQEADVALATVSVSLFRVSLRLACSHSHSNWRRQDPEPDPDPDPH